MVFASVLVLKDFVVKSEGHREQEFFLIVYFISCCGLISSRAESFLKMMLHCCIVVGVLYFGGTFASVCVEEVFKKSFLLWKYIQISSDGWAFPGLVPLNQANSPVHTADPQKQRALPS